MSWEDILKKVSRRERAEAEEFATEDMDDWKKESKRLEQDSERLELQSYAKRQGHFIQKVERFIESNIPHNDGIRSTLAFLIDGLEKEMVKDYPKKIKNYRYSIITLLKNYGFR